MIRINEVYKNVPVYQPGKSIEEVKREFGLQKVIKLASNENPFGASKKVAGRILKELGMLSTYPDGAARKLRSQLASFYGIAEQQLIFGNGSDEIVQFLSRVYLNTNTEVIMAAPTFPMYKANAMMEGAIIIEVPLTDGKHDLEAMAKKITEKTAMVWICNPNNPTGTIITEDELKQFLTKVPENVLVILDEAYAEYVTAKDFPNIFQLLEKHPNLMVLRTFSKIYGLAGLRIGYGIANEEIIADLHKVKEPFNANYLAQVSAEEALLDQEYVHFCKEENQKNMEYFLSGLQSLHIAYYPSQANFVLVKHHLEDSQLFNRFIQEGIIIRPGDKLGSPGTFRVTIGTIEQMKQVLDVLKKIVETETLQAH